MTRVLRRFAIFVFSSWIGVISATAVKAQDTSDKINANLGAGLTVPVGPSSRVASKSPGVVGGVGYNFTEHHSFVGEFAWHGLEPSNGALEPIRASAQDNTIEGHSNLYSVTANYRYQMQRKVFGAYFIGGGGWYYRTVGLSTAVTSPANVPCTTAWRWWGFKCSSGTVIPGQTIRHMNSSAFGGNAGIGFTAKVADPSYRAYVELRYHYAPTKNISTQVMDVTVGIRY